MINTQAGEAGTGRGRGSRPSRAWHWNSFNVVIASINHRSMINQSSHQNSYASEPTL
jgi:hypothetical protein